MKSMDPKEIAERAKVLGAERNARAERLPVIAQKIINSCPKIYRTRLIKALLGEASAKVSIRAQCEQCVGWEEVKLRVGGCRAFGCALHHLRPYQDR